MLRILRTIILKVSDLVLDTTFNVERHNNTNLQLPIIDYDAIYNNSINNMMLYLKAYLNQGQGNYQLDHFTLVNYNHILPVLFETSCYQNTATSPAYKLKYNGCDSLKNVASMIINKYLRWLKEQYDKQSTGDFKVLEQAVCNDTFIFTPTILGKYLVDHLDQFTETSNSYRIQDFLLTGINYTYLIDLLLEYDKYYELNSSAIKLIFTIIMQNNLYDVDMAELINKIYYSLNGLNHTKIKYDTFSFNYTCIYHMFGKRKLVMPLNALTQQATFDSNLNKIEIKLVNLADLNCFISALINNNLFGSIEHAISWVNDWLTSSPQVVLNTTIGLDLIKQKYHNLRSDDSDTRLILKYLLKQYQN